MPIRNMFTYAGFPVQFTQNPLRESDQTGQALQVMGRLSDETQYVYDKSRVIRDRYRLIFPRESSLTRDDLLTFQSLVGGNSSPFLWYDSEGVVRTAWLDGEIRIRPVEAGKYRIEVSLEEETSWTPATDTSLESTYAAPICILKLTVNAVDYYLADSTLYIPAWAVTTKPWVGSWGSVRAGVTGGLDEFQVSDFSVTLLIDPAANPNMETLATSYPLETSPAQLYLYDCSGSASPELKFTGYVRDVDLPDDTAVEVVIEDETVRLASSHVGTRVDTVTYPAADPDDVGKVVPVVYGALTKLPAVCVESGFASSITADLDVESTSFYLSAPVPTAYSLVGRVIIADAEQMYVSAASNSYITVTRGYNGTTATAHDMGSVVIEDRSANPLVYLVADHPVTTISNVLTRVAGIDVDITPDCTVYLGSEGSEHASYPGMAVIEISNFPAIAKRTNQAIFETGHSHNSASSSSENTTLTLPVSLVYYGTYPQPSGYPYVPGLCYYKPVTFPASGGSRSSCSYSVTINPTTTRAGVKILAVINGVCLNWWDCNLVNNSPLVLTFTAEGSLAAYNSVDIVQVGAGAGSYFNITVASRLVYLSSTPSTYSSSGASLTGNSVADILVGSMVMVNCSRTIDIPGIMDDLVARGGLSGSTTLVGNLSETYKPRYYDFVTTPGHVATYFTAINATLTTNANGMVVTATADDYQFTFTNAYSQTRFTRIRLRFRRVSGAGSWDGKLFWANSQHGHDGSYYKQIPQPADLSAWNTVELDMTTAVGASDYLAYTISSLRFDLGSGAADVYEIAWIEIVRTNTEGILGGAITEYRPALEWLNLIAFQCRCWFRRDRGESKLIMRPDTLNSSRTIAACAITEDGRRRHRRRKVNPADLINRINLLYNRDWTMSGDEAYKSAYTISDATSISAYGEHEQPDLFRFDFAAALSSATVVADYYLATCKDRGWIHEFDVYLDYHDLEFGDVVTLGFAGGVVGQVMSVGLNPGNSNQIDTIRVTVAV